MSRLHPSCHLALGHALRTQLRLIFFVFMLLFRGDAENSAQEVNILRMLRGKQCTLALPVRLFPLLGPAPEQAAEGTLEEAAESRDRADPIKFPNLEKSP